MIAVWGILVLAMLAMLAIFAVVLFRKLIGLLHELSELVARTAILDGVHRAEPEPRPLPAVLAGPASASPRWHARRYRSRERRSARRTARIARGTALVNAEATAIHWFQR